MRHLINLIESTGLANRKPGTVFANPQGDRLIFQGVKFYPEGGGAYETPEKFQQALQQLSQQLGITPNLIQWMTPKGESTTAPSRQKGVF